MSNFIVEAFINLINGPWIFWVVMLEFFLLFLLSVWQKGLLSEANSSQGIEHGKDRDKGYDEYNPQYLEQISFFKIDIEAGI